jgi:hypothetical protein
MAVFKTNSEQIYVYMLRHMWIRRQLWIITNSYTEISEIVGNMTNIVAVDTFSSNYEYFPVIIHNYRCPLVNVLETHECCPSKSLDETYKIYFK